MKITPFKYGCVVAGEFFCPRPEQQRELARIIASGQNVVVQGERRMGKTSLVCEAVRSVKGMKLLYIDLLGIGSMADFCRKVTAAVASVKSTRTFLDRILGLLRRLRPSLTVDPVTGAPTLSVDVSYAGAMESAEDVMDMLGKVAKAEKLCVVFDEFQDMLKVDDAPGVLAMMRSKIQFQNEVPYVFLGSVRNKMADIFANSRSPFYKSAALFDIGAIDPQAFKEFLRKRFAVGGRKVEPEVLERVIAMTNGISGDIQEFCDALWASTEEGESITADHIATALELVFARESKSYVPVLNQLTALQTRVLKGLAENGECRPFSMEFMDRVKVHNAGSVRKAIERMENLDVLYFYEGRYRFANPFFAIWLVRN